MRLLAASNRSRAAASTLARIFSDTEAPWVKVRETAERDTPARSATSLRVGPAIGRVFSALQPVARPVAYSPVHSGIAVFETKAPIPASVSRAIMFSAITRPA